MYSRLVSLLLLFAVQSVASAQTRPDKTTQRPNIILILADDLGYGDIGVNGQKLIKTPNIDRLAAEGMRFTQFYAGTSVCAPSRSALMTGKHTGHTYIRGNKAVEPEGQQPIADSVLTIGEILQKAGYTTAAFGKWGLGPVGSEGDPNKQGFDRFYGYNCQSLAHRYYPNHLWNNSEKIVLKENENRRGNADSHPGCHQPPRSEGWWPSRLRCWSSLAVVPTLLRNLPNCCTFQRVARPVTRLTHMKDIKAQHTTLRKVLDTAAHANSFLIA